MTFRTGDRGVFSRQAKPRSVMVEGHWRFPCIESVALLARAIELPLVDVTVTGDAFPDQTEEGVGRTERRVLLHVTGLPQRGGMAFLALERCMFT
jgi:hypothetical protein